MRDYTRRLRRGCVDWIGLPLTELALRWLARVRRTHRIDHLPNTRRACVRAGVYPIVDHFYEPLIDRSALRFDEERSLPGLVWQPAAQWHLVESFEHSAELAALPFNRSETGYYLDNGYFGPGDADLYYSLIRSRKPKRIVEIGSGHSTRLAALALARNADEGLPGVLVCVEPYRHPDWIRAAGAELVAVPVEQVPPEVFAALTADDVLFIDSSHMIRPQGDVLFEILEVLPSLAPGVLVHVHDIFSPAEYPQEWVVERMHFWNEQYLLEAFLTFNGRFEILCGLQYLLRKDAARLERALPRLAERRHNHAATSFWMRVTG